jgi:protein CMS1
VFYISAAAGQVADMGKSKRPRDVDANENRPRKKTRITREVDDSLLDEQHGVNKAFQLMDSQLLADYLAQKTSRFGKDLTVVELADLSISGQ